MNTSIIVHQAQVDGSFMEIRHPTGHPSTASNHEIHLVRVGLDAGSQYPALIQAADQSAADQSDQSERVDSGFANLTLHFPPEFCQATPQTTP